MKITMKRIEEQTYYEILEVSPNATAKEIQKAYDHAKETFHPESLAVYSLFSEKEIKEIRVAIEKAYRVLMNDALRKSYNQSPLQTPGEQLEEKVQEIEGISQKETSSLSFTDLIIHSEEENYRGKRLREIREMMGIDLKTISAKTKVNKKILEWIEEEALDKLPALVYLKGFLKGYAESLGLDPEKVVERYLQFLNEKKKK